MYIVSYKYIARDILQHLIDTDVHDLNHFNWTSQLKYYWKYDDIGNLENYKIITFLVVSFSFSLCSIKCVQFEL